MEERTAELLADDDLTLFTHGGCHVFALALREFSGLPLLWVRETDGTHDHLGCRGQAGQLVDVFGWYSLAEYIRSARLDGKSIRFVGTDEDAVRSRFIQGRGKGYYAHRDFFDPAMARAQTWITSHRQYFDGTIKGPIPNLSRLNRLGRNRILEILG